MGRKGSIAEKDLRQVMLRLFPVARDKNGVLTAAPISYNDLWKKANEVTKKPERIGSLATFQKYLNILLEARLVIKENGQYKRSPVSLRWEWTKETQIPGAAWVKTLETEQGLRERFQIAFEFVLKAYVEMLLGLVTIEDDSTARKYLELFFQSRPLDGPLIFLAQSIHANRNKVPVGYSQRMVMRISAGSGVLGRL